MNRRDLLKASAASAAVALPLIGYRTSRAGPVGGAVYIDASASGTGHSGTFADPYSTADARIYFSLLEGDLQNLRIRFRAGTTFVGQIAIEGINYFIEPYGAGAAPVISPHVDISNLTWAADDGARNGGTPTADVYYIPVSGGTGSTWSAGQTAVIFVDGGVYRQCENRNSYADLIGPLYECTETAYPSGYPFLQYWDTATTPNRMWIRGPSGWNPNAMTVVRPMASVAALALSRPAGVTVSDIDVQCGANINFLATGVVSLTVDNVRSGNAGGNPEAAQNCFGFVGVSKAAPGEITLRALRAFRSRQTLAHGLELSWVRGTIDDYDVRDVLFHGIEFWNSCRDLTIRRMKVRQTASQMCFQLGAEGASESHHQNILVQNSDVVQRASYTAHGTGSGYVAGGFGVQVSSFGTNYKVVSNLRLYNGSYDLDGSFALYGYIADNAGLGNNVVIWKGNAVRISQLTNFADGGIRAPETIATAATWVADRNVYQFGVTPAHMFTSLGTPAATPAGMWSGVTGATMNEANSVLLGPSGHLFSAGGAALQMANLSLINELVAAVGLADSGDAYTPATDILGVTRSSPDAGAYEYVVGSDATPEPVDFADQTNVETDEDITSAVITIAGLTTGATISVANGSYEIDASGSFVTSAGTIYNGQTLRARVHSSNFGYMPNTVTVTVGGTDITFTATTGEGGPTGPAQFTFTGFFEADLFTTYTSLPVSLTGLTGTAAISVTGDASARYSVNSTTVFTALLGTAVNGDVIRARVTTGGNDATFHDAVITINGVVGTYRVATEA